MQFKPHQQNPEANMMGIEPKLHSKPALLLMLGIITALAVLNISTNWTYSSEVPSVGKDDKQNVATAKPSIDESSVVRIDVEPTEILLQHQFDYRQILLTGHLENGQTIDLTRRAKLLVENSIVEIDANRLVTPVMDGQETIRFAFGSHLAEVDVQVDLDGSDFQPGFVRDVQPVISRLGCNQGTCHGSKDGKNGFRLSLRGYDAIFDYRGFTDDIGARRINRAAPDQSLMLLKASGAIPHVGGGLTQPDERYYELIRQWIANGVEFDGESAPKVTRIEVTPKNPILPRAGLTQQIRVLAHYDNDLVRDVTREAFIESGNIEVVEAQKNGVVTLLRRGEAPILVRYEGAYATTILTVMGDRSGFSWQETPEFNYIDSLVYDKLQKVKVLPSGLCTDSEFIRRVSIDLTGLPPTPEALQTFLSDPADSRTKRAKLVDQLLGSPEYVEHWTNKWADLLQVNRKFLGEEGAIALRNWIKGNVASNTPYDQFAEEILTASGSTLENPPAAYYKVLREPTELMENTTHLFLAVRFNCNKCHDHPFERWTQDQYYEMSAYFAQVKMKEDPRFSGKKIGGSAVEGAKPLVEVVFDTTQGEVKHDRTGQNMAPAFPYLDGELNADQNASRRTQLASWIVSPDNRYFAKSHVNRLWGYLFGVGIIEPIDDIRAGNPPTNPELLEALTKDFVAHGFDSQHILRTICNSRVYQQSYETNRWNEDDQINYSHAIPRRLSAESLYDAIHAATGAPSQFPGIPAGTRAAELPDAGIASTFLDDFGKPARESACECERSSGMVLGPIMKLVNGPTVANAINNPSNRIHQLIKTVDDDRELVRQMFLAFLAREPSEAEIELGLSAIEWAGEDLEANQADLDSYRQSRLESLAAWEANLTRKPAWKNIAPNHFESKVDAKFELTAEESIFVSGPNGKDTYKLEAELASESQLTGIKLEALPSERLPAGGPGRAKNGNFVLSEFTVTAVSVLDPTATKQLKLANPIATFSQEGWNVAGAIDGLDSSGWAVSPQFNKAHTALFSVEDFQGFEGGTRLRFELNQQFPDSAHSLGHFRISLTDSKGPLNFSELPADLAAILSKPKDARTESESARILAEFFKDDQTYSTLQAAVAQSKRERENPRLAGMQDLAWALINSPAFLFNR